MSLQTLSRKFFRSMPVTHFFRNSGNKCLVLHQRLSISQCASCYNSTKAGVNQNDLPNEKTFEELLDESPLMQFGRAPGKCVIGKVVNVCNEDLYVDFGAKFEAVVKRPEVDKEFYKLGAKVRLILNKFEMTGSFLGDERHITLCEADAILLGPYSDTGKPRKE